MGAPNKRRRSGPKAKSTSSTSATTGRFHKKGHSSPKSEKTFSQGKSDNIDRNSKTKKLDNKVADEREDSARTKVSPRKQAMANKNKTTSNASGKKNADFPPKNKRASSDSEDDSSSSGTSSSENDSIADHADPKKEVNKESQIGKAMNPEKSDKKINDDSDDDNENDSDDRSDDNSDDGSDGDSDSSLDAKKKGRFFSDENSAWLKPKEKSKAKLLDSEDEEEDDEIGDDDNYGEEDDDEMETGMERESRKLDAEMRLQEEEADEEFRETVAKNSSIYHLPTSEELERENADRVVPPSELRSHIESILEVLADFSKRREPGRSRSEYVEHLTAFLAELFGYLPELMEYFMSMFGPSETLEFVESSDKTRPMVIRTNTLKTRRKDLAMALMKRGVSLDPLAGWSKVGLKIIESPVPIGATPEYLSGHYMLQSAASMCPVLALDPQPKEKVLDMSAAPGGKTSYIAQLMKNTGVIFANDLKADRQKATVANMHRLGVKNVVACTHDGRKLAQLFAQFRFDRVLLDAPCSGLGVISRDPSVKVQRTLADVKKCAHLQKELLLAAIDVLSTKSGGGIMVYSTCSVSVAENEEVVNYALQKRDIRIIETGLDFGKPGFTRYQQKRFHPSVARTRRFFPHVHNMDGFYVAKIQKLSDKCLGEVNPTTAEKSEESLGLDPEKGVGVKVSDDDENEGEGKRQTSKLEQKSKRGKSPKKRKPNRGKDDEEDNKDKKRAKGGRHLSVPPTPPKQQKPKAKKLSAKMTKPRRKKQATDE